MDRYVNLGSSVSQLLLLVVVARVCQLHRRVHQGPLALPRYRSSMRDIDCACGETTALTGTPGPSGIVVSCQTCGRRWIRGTGARCDRCGGTDLQSVPMAIIEKGRGTQLSVVGTRTITLCSACDADDLRRYHDHRPNPLMPAELPTVHRDV